VPRVLTLLMVVVLAPAVDAADPVKVADVPLPAGLVAANTKAVVAAGVCFLEGPAVDDRGNVYFSDIAGNRILKMDADGKVSVFRADSGRTNGNTFEAMGRLISCEGAENGPGGRRRIARTDLKTGEVTVLTEKEMNHKDTKNTKKEDKGSQVVFVLFFVFFVSLCLCG
jgi:sugar lactone lactonase YvrE